MRTDFETLRELISGFSAGTDTRPAEPTSDGLAARRPRPPLDCRVPDALAPGPQDPAAQSTNDVAPIGGQVWTIDLVSGITTCSPTVAVDRCETCSGRYEGRRDGLPALAALLPERRGEVA